MTTIESSVRNRWQRPWIAMVAGVVAHLGVATLLAYLVVIGGDLLSNVIEPHRLDWIHQMDDTTSVGWLVLQVISLLSGLASGIVAALLSPPRSKVAVGALLLFAISTAFFAQLPNPRSALIIAIWSLATPVGILLGAATGRRRPDAV